MPVIPVAAAIAASAVAASAVATVGLTVITALEITAAVGATLGAIGTITHNKGLATAGLVIGAVGAIGGFAAGAGVLGESAASDAPLFGATPAQSTVDATAGAAGAGATADAAAADAASANTVDAFSGAAGAADLPTPPVPPPAATAGAAGATAGAADTATAAVPAGTELAAEDAATVQASTQAAAASGTNEVGLATTGVNPADAVAPGTTGTGSGLINATPNVTEPGTALTPNAPAPGSGLSATANPELNTSAAATEATASTSGLSGILGKIVDYAGAHPVVALGALQAGGSLLSGAFSSLTPAQVTALNAQAAANDAAAGLTNQQRTNLAMPKAVASLAPVTGTPAPLVPTPPVSQGFINQAPRTQVTGVPA